MNTKKYLLLLIIGAFTSLEIISQCNLPSQLPSNLAELEAANRTIAEYFAPTIHQMTENTEYNSANGRADLFTSVFYDGNMNTGDNWESLQMYETGNPSTHDELDPLVYYSVVWTNYAWIVTYAFYHPRDYSSENSPCCLDNHENDLEGAVFVVERISEQVIGAYTISHFDLINYDDVTSVPDIFIDNGTHAVKADIGSGCIDGLNPCDNCKEFSEPHITYNFASNGIASVSATTSTTFTSNLVGTGSYILEDIFGSHPESLNNQRNNPTVFLGDLFYQITPNPDNTDCMDQGAASAPWGWGQFDYLVDDVEFMICSAYHGFALCHQLSPAQLFNSPSDPIIMEYNPYLGESSVVCNNSLDGLNLTVSSDTDWNGLSLNNQDVQIRTLKVTNNSTLTLSSFDDFRMMLPGKITVGSGSTLILDNSNIRPCDPDTRWRGIFLENGASIELKNNSSIKQSRLGIYNHTDLNSLVDWEGNLSFDYYNFTDSYSETSGNNSVIINNSTLEDNFTSLVLDGDDNVVYVMNDSYVKNSQNAIMIRGNESGGFEFDSSHFDENDKSIFTYQCGDRNSIYSCDFNNDEIVTAQISLNYTEGVDFQKNKMKGPGFLIQAWSSFVSIFNGNEFLDSRSAISVGGTAPLESNVIIGSLASEANYFSGNEKAIVLNGNNSTVGGLVNNNHIDDAINIGIAVNGIGLYDISNNNIENTEDGVYYSKSGGAFSSINCNSFTDNDNQDLTIEKVNNNTVFLNNDFSDSQNEGNIILSEANIWVKQGDIDNPSDNCFHSNSTENLYVDATTESFQYYHNTEVSCRVPTYNEYYNPIGVLTDGNNCDVNGIGSNFIDNDPDIDIDIAQLPFPFPDLPTPGIIGTNINNALNNLVAVGGDNPYTYVDESSTNTEVLPNQIYPIAYFDNIQVIYNSESELDYWIRAGIYYSIQNNDYAYGENILTPMKKWRWQEMLFGLYLKSKQYTKARLLLNNLPNNTAYEGEFIILQNINLDRFINGEKSITNAQKQLVHTIATGNTPAAGYAIPLYYYLTGITLENTVPSRGESTKKRKQLSQDSKIKISPNPVQNLLSISNLYEEKINSIEILDQYQAVRKTVTLNGTNKIDVSQLPSGWYMLRCILNNKESITIPFVKL
jgi:hypothetical protein